MDDLAPADLDALWSLASPDDLRRIADLARRIFAVPAVLLLSEGSIAVRFASGEQDAAVESAAFDAALILDGGPRSGQHGGQRIGTLRILGERDWTSEDRAILDDLAGCLTSLIASRHAVGSARNAEAGPAEQAPVELEEGGADSASVHILLADDLDLNRKLISDMLSIEGHAVDSVADGAAAVKAVGEHSYDIILMDMIMPVMDGMAATRAIRAMPAPACDVPIVALTAHSLPEQLDNCLKAGVDAILTKPMSVAALTDAVMTWSRRGRRAA